MQRTQRWKEHFSCFHAIPSVTLILESLHQPRNQNANDDYQLKLYLKKHETARRFAESLELIEEAVSLHTSHLKDDVPTTKMY